MIFFKGVLIGLLMAAPVGPVGILCIERTLTKSKHSGFISGLGAATADGLYAAVAAFGISVISDFISAHDIAVRLIGGLIILWVGIRSLINGKAAKPSPVTKKFGHAGDYASTFLFTLTNPTTIFSFGVVFALTGFRAAEVTGLLLPTLLVAGVALGSLLWWLILTNGVAYLSGRMQSFSLDVVKKIAGLLIIIFALIILSGLRHG